MSTITEHRSLARRTGIAYLGIVVTGIFAEFVVRGPLVVPDDAAATARNIADSPGLFGLGIAADVVMIALDVLVAVGLFRLLRPIEPRLAKAAMVLRLVQGAVIAVSLLQLTRALGLARDAVGPGGSILPGPADAALEAIDRHALGYDAGLIAFALSCLVLAQILFAHRLVSRPLAIGMGVTGAVYLVGSITAFVAPSVNVAIDPLYVVAAVVEPAFAIRLIRRGLGTADPVAPPRRPGRGLSTTGVASRRPRGADPAHGRVPLCP
jgi:Domain of unknown function (DUF4386)